MFRYDTNTASFFTVLIAGLIFSRSLAGIAAAQTNTSLGTGTLQNNTTGQYNTATGFVPLFSDNLGSFNTPIAPLLNDPQSRAEHWFSRRGLQFGMSTGAYGRAVSQMRVMEAAQERRRRGDQPKWNFIGPEPMLNALSNFGGVILPIGNGDLGKFSSTGRISAIATDPTTPGRLFVGAANGGVWMSTDGGNTFTPIGDALPTQAIGAIVLDTVNSSPPTIYVGTGGPQ